MVAFKRNKSFGSLIFYCIILSLWFPFSLGYADDSILNLSQKPSYMGSLDYFHDQNIYLPYYDASSSSVTSGASILSPFSGYKLADTNGSGNNVIAKYVFDPETGKYVLKKYLLKIVNPNVVEDNTAGLSVKYFSWSKDSYGNKSLVTGSAISHDVAYYYDSTLVRSKQSISSSTIDNISGIFIQQRYSDGGAIKIEDNSIIKNIDAIFIGNSASLGSFNLSSGGAIYNNVEYRSSRSIIANIKGYFISNYVSGNDVNGGAIFNRFGPSENPNNRARIVSIVGEFIGNYAYGSGIARGGAIYNVYGYIDNVIADFIQNYTYSVGTDSRGGAITNFGYIGNITGDFIENYAKGKNVYGGALENNNVDSRAAGVIESISGNFIGNAAINVNSSGFAYGGAIYNKNTIGEVINSSFLGNYVSSVSSSAKGGAIWTNADMTFVADNGNSVFSGNYVQIGAGNKDNQAIWVNNSNATLLFKAQNNGIIRFDDNINGSKGYKVNLTGDSSGHIIFNNEIKNTTVSLEKTTLTLGVTNPDEKVSNVFKTSDLVVKSGIVDTKDGTYANYNIQNLKAEDNARFAIDLVLNKDEQKTDTFTVGKGSSGFIHLSSINVTNDLDNEDEKILQVIKLADGVTSSVAPELLFEGTFINDAQANMTSDMVVGKDFAIVTTKTKNDSLRIRGLKDNFAAWLELDGVDDKTYEFIDNTNYILSHDVENIVGKTLTVTGAGNHIDGNNKKLFSNINEEQTLNISNLDITHAKTITNQGNFILKDVGLDVDVVNDGAMIVSGNGQLSGHIENNGNIVLDESDVTITGEITSNIQGNFTFNNVNGLDINHKFQNQKIVSNNSVLNINDIRGFVNNELTIKGGTVNIAPLGLDKIILKKLDMQGGDINLSSIDVDLEKEIMGGLYIDEYAENNKGTVRIKNMIITNDTRKEISSVLFIDNEKGIDVNIEEVFVNNGSKEIYGPIYKYSMRYDASSGKFVFTKNKGNFSFNPSVFEYDVFAQSGLRMQEDMLEKIDVSQQFDYCRGNAWAIPYYSKDNVKFSNFYDVDTENSGIVVGIDTKAFRDDMFFRVHTLFAGYNEGKDKYQNLKVNTKSSLIGFKTALYHEKFYASHVVNYAFHNGDVRNLWGKDKFDTVGYGTSIKLGQQQEFGRWKLDGSAKLNFQMIEGDKLKSATGSMIDTTNYKRLTFEPQIKANYKLNEEVQSYAFVRYNFVLSESGRTTVSNNTIVKKLSDIETRDYIEYGVGTEIAKGYKHNGYTALSRRDGGRQGWNFEIGYKYTFY